MTPEPLQGPNMQDVYLERSMGESAYQIYYLVPCGVENVGASTSHNPIGLHGRLLQR
jgi:hypothetical protein